MWNYALSPATLRTYEAAYNLYIKFLVLRNLYVNLNGSIPPISEDIIIKFVIYCSEVMHLKWCTIKLYLAGVRFHFIKAGIGKPLDQCFRLSYILKAVRRRQSLLSSNTAEREPITFTILSKLCQLLSDGAFNNHTDAMLLCAFHLAYFGFLRCAEFTNKSCSDRKNNIVLLQDISFSTNSYTFHLKSSKTDPFCHGVPIVIFANSVSCPVASMRKFISLRRYQGASNSSPLFLDYDNCVLTRYRFIAYLRHLLVRMGLNEKLYGGHSFRIGAATTAGAAGVEDHLIQTMGRWYSDCYTRYIRTSNNSIKNAQLAMCYSPQ